MAWETRKGKRYLYIKRREGGKVVSQYIGAASTFGEFHELSETFSCEQQFQRDRQRAAIRAIREEVDALSGDVAAVCDGIEALTRAILISAGYHRHDRGHWRKRRKAVDMATSKAIAKVDDRQALEKDLAKRMDGLIEKANTGDARAMKELRPLIQQAPTVFECFGDMATAVQSAIIRKMSGQQLLIQDRVQARLREMGRELCGPSPTPLERLLVERILTCWLEVQWYDYQYTESGNVTLKQGDYFQRRQDRAHKRYLTAIKTLAQVRRLALPAVQVNIAGQQVNTQAVFTGTPVQE